MIRWVDKRQMAAVRHVIAGHSSGILIHPPGMWENDDQPDIHHWFAISDCDGIFVYTDTQDEASQLAAHFDKTATRETIDEHIERNAMRLPRSAFTEAFERIANSEGWCLSERSDGYLELQRLDEGVQPLGFDEVPRPVFVDDQAAVDFISEKARSGSYMHQVALHLDGTPIGKD